MPGMRTKSGGPREPESSALSRQQMPGQRKPQLREGAATFLRLQQTLGNQAMQRLLGSMMTANQPGNENEQEAGQVANTVVKQQARVSTLADSIQHHSPASQTISRIPRKGGIKKGDYSFSTKCGWIDWGHANPGLAKKLIAKVGEASDDLKSQSVSTPTMQAKGFGVVFSSASMQVRLARPLAPDEVLAVALSIFKNLSIIFEIQQEWTDWFSSSSFAQEDLPSNLISFYRAAKGFTRDQISQYCDAQDIAASLQEYDRNHDFQKNHTFSPIGVPEGAWPAELSTIDETKGAALYKISSVTVGSPASGYTFCPLYRLQGKINETDLFIFGVGGVTFTEADNVRVVPTYRVDTDRVSGSGHIPYVEVEPYGQADAGMLVT
jgi:hypothetical protein